MASPPRDDEGPPPPGWPLRLAGLALAALAILAVGFVVLRVIDVAGSALGFLTRPRAKAPVTRTVAPVEVAPPSDDASDDEPPPPAIASTPPRPARRDAGLPDAVLPIDAGHDAGLDATLFFDAGFDASRLEGRHRDARLDVVAAVEAHYAPVTSFKADVAQAIHVRSTGIVKRLRGRVAFAKPGQMAFAYSYPAGDRVVSNGSTLDAYEVSARRVLEEPAGDSPYALAFCFLTGHEGSLSAAFDFHVRAAEPGEIAAAGSGYVVTGTPKVATTGVQKVIYDVDGATMDVTRVVIIDGQGNRNLMDLTRPRLNEGVDPGEFAFVPPTGVTIVRP